MRLVSLNNCQPGIKVGKTIYHENGIILLAKGTELTDHLIRRLKEFNIYTIYIEDEISEGIEIVESIPEELRIEAINVITDGLNALAELGSNAPNIQRITKSDRAIRSMQKIFKDIKNTLSENEKALNLLASTKVYENHVYNHSLNVAIYACQLAIENGLPIKNIEEIGLGAMLHDLGKLYISKDILNKPGKLTDEEYEEIKKHCQLGFDVLKKIHEIPLSVAHCAFQHHERIDGKGYPRGLKDAEIHKYAKILSVADVFDALTSQRSYRKPMLPHKALEVLYSGSGTQFESKQVQLFRDCIVIYPQGLTVKLNDGRTGIVSKYHVQAVGRPVIRIFKDENDQEVKPYEIDLSSPEHLMIEIVEADTLL